MKSPLACPFIAAVCFSAVLPIQAVELDPAFNPQVPEGTVRAVLANPAGEIFVGGEFAGPTGLVKLRADGIKDATFTGALSGGVYALAAGPAGGVYVGGSFPQGLVSVAPSGALATSFTPTAANGRIYALVSGNSNELVLGGSFWSQPDVFVASLGMDGAVKNGFHSGLKPNFSLEAGVTAVALQPDGKLLVGGNFDAAGQFSSLARLNADGSIDSSFAASSGAILYVKAIVVLSDGRIFIAGTRDSSGTGFVRLLNPDGTIDPSFAEPVLDRSVEAVVLDDSGQIVVGGSFTAVNGQASVHLARLHLNGTRDQSWTISANGPVTTLVPDSAGRILAGGAFTEIGGAPRLGLARLVETKSSFAFTSLAVGLGGEMHLSLQGDTGLTYVIESSADLKSWTVFKTNVATAEGLAVSVTASEMPRKFFRARLLE